MWENKRIVEKKIESHVKNDSCGRETSQVEINERVRFERNRPCHLQTMLVSCCRPPTCTRNSTGMKIRTPPTPRFSPQKCSVQVSGETVSLTEEFKYRGILFSSGEKRLANGLVQRQQCCRSVVAKSLGQSTSLSLPVLTSC